MRRAGKPKSEGGIRFAIILTVVTLLGVFGARLAGCAPERSAETADERARRNY